MSCARDGSTQNIVYTVLREVEKEVVLIEPQPLVRIPVNADPGDSTTAAAESTQMDVDQAQTAEPQVLKLIKKLEVQVLCQQHNPVRSSFCFVSFDRISMPARRRLQKPRRLQSKTESVIIC